MGAMTIHSMGQNSRALAAAAVAPLVVLPTAAFVAFARGPAWVLMWMLAGSFYAGLKWLTLATCPAAHQSSRARRVAYLLLWPGMDAAAFCASTAKVDTPKFPEWLLALTKLALGGVWLAIVAPRLVAQHPMTAGWVAMVGIIFVLHFGAFHLLSLGWRAAGIDAQPIMNFPILATSLSDFWGRRWNLAFRDVAFGQLFRPLARRVGAAQAMLVVFIASGIVHDLVISLPAHAGWGGPTGYFALQGFGLLLEKSDWGKRLGLGSGITGRLFCGLLTVGPIGFLFHPPFVRCVILPLLTAIKSA